ncbi:MAG: non-ribosomal peptide synthetase, partial [Shimia sp.]
AAARTGAVAPLNPASTEREFTAAIQHAKLDLVIVATGQDCAAVPAAQSLGVPVARLTPEYRFAGHGAAPQDLRSVGADDLALLLFTSGSTGAPKLVPLTHRNVMTSAADVARSVSLGEEDACLVMWEQFHIGGLVDLLLAPLVSGGRVILAGTFDATRFFSLCDAFDPTWFQAVPTTLGEVIFQGRRSQAERPAPSLRFVRVVAAALPPAQQATAEAYFGRPIVRTLGMTEAGPLITSTRLPPAAQKPGSVGRSAGPEVTIFGEDGTPCDVGSIGQVAVRGPNVFAGYEANDAANEASFRGDWFLTGDQGYFDQDGDLFLTGRLKELINRGGEKISPQEVEAELAAHPAVREAAVFGLEHRTLGEDVACAVSLSAAATPQDIRAFLHTRVAAFKVPSIIHVLEALPRNPVGKVDKAALRSQLDARREEGETADGEQPTTDLQKQVAAIWARELDVDQPGLNQDFADLDGDSLSAMRIMIGLEQAFDRPMPDGVMAHFTTIGEMADYLATRGISATANQTVRAPSGANEPFDFKDAQGQLEPEACRSLIERAGSRVELRLRLDAFTSDAPQPEVADLLAALAGVRPGFHAGRATLLSQLRMRIELSRWKRRTRRALAADLNGPRWTRSALRDGLLLYSDQSVPAEQKTLILGFTGNWHRLMMPTYQVLSGLDPTSADLLILMDHSKRLFFDGIESINGGAPGLNAFLRTFAADAGYAKVITLGTSGGGLACVATAAEEGWSHAVCIAPASIDDHPEWYPRLRAAAQVAGISLALVHSKRPKDVRKTRGLGLLFPDARRHTYAYFGKNVLRAAYKRGDLREELTDWLRRAAEPDAARPPRDQQRALTAEERD